MCIYQDAHFHGYDLQTGPINDWEKDAGKYNLALKYHKRHWHALIELQWFLITIVRFDHIKFQET